MGDGDATAATDSYAPARLDMVTSQIEARRISDAAVLDAMRRVPRHRFVPASLRDQASELPDGTALGPPLDTDCTAPEKVTYLYLATGASALTPLPDVTILPADIAEVTTLAGATVPFVVRVETGGVNRGIYQSAVLHDPTREPAPTPFQPPLGWNRRLIAIQGFGCPGGWYTQGGAQGNLSMGGANFSLLNLDQTELKYRYCCCLIYRTMNRDPPSDSI